MPVQRLTFLLARVNRRSAYLALSLVVLVAGGLRLLAASNDLWFDELYSLATARNTTSPWQVFTQVHLDNNHYLNTLFLRLMPLHGSALAFRSLSLACGLALVPVGFWVLSGRSRREGLFYAMFLAVCYPLIHFASEARGYSGAALGSLLAAGALVRWLKQPKPWLEAAYIVGILLGLLSHLTVVLVWVPLAAGAAATIVRREFRSRHLFGWVAMNLPPLFAFTALYLIDIRHLDFLLAPPMMPGKALVLLLDFTLGWPRHDGVAAAGLSLLMAGWAVFHFHRAREAFWLPLALVYLSPLPCLVWLHPLFFNPRYFFVFVPFFCLPFALMMDRIAGAFRPAGAALWLAIFIGGQIPAYVRLARAGRGNFNEALGFIASHTSGSVLRITSNFDLRSYIELPYFMANLSKGHELYYVERKDQRLLRPDWYILHREGSEPPGPARLEFPRQSIWYRVGYYGCSELSGQAWTIYVHASDDPGSIGRYTGSFRASGL